MALVLPFFHLETLGSATGSVSTENGVFEGICEIQYLTLSKVLRLNDEVSIQGINVDSYKCLWAFIGCYTRFSGLQSSLGITNGNRSHNKPLELI